MSSTAGGALGRRAEAGTEHAVKTSGKIGGDFSPQKNAEFIKRRLQIFETLYQKQEENIKVKDHSPIRIELPDGTEKEGKKFETSPLDIAMEISKNFASSVIVAKVLYKEKLEEAEQLACADKEEEGEEEEEVQEEEEDEEAREENRWILWDLARPLEGSCKLKMLKFDDANDEAKNVFWHSSAHMLGESIEAEYGAHLTIGPALSPGFYYDAYMGDLHLNIDAYALLEKQMERITRENQKFYRLVCTKEEALEMFKDNPFKVQLIQNKIPEGGKTTCYRCGDLVDLCRGPHVPSTGRIKAFSITKHSSAYWLGKNDHDSLQRVYGISFPEQKQLKEYHKLVEEAKKKDHRLVGQNLNFYFFDTMVSAGSCFWLPHGARLYNRLCEFMKTEYRLRGFSEVLTPNIFSCDLWKISGHYDNYKENMYLFDVEGKEWGLKPMNCPGHCIMFKHMSLSYRQLPLRLADFGVLHRNELSGTLAGLTRVRRFQQDDAHIFCRLDQLESEVSAALDFLFFVYGKFGFKFELKLATRPKKALGCIDLWKKAESALRKALNSTGMEWSVNPGDGAFYGPKIDICVWDALKRAHQCGTIQVDFQLPIRFNLSYKTEEATRPNTNEKRDGAEEDMKSNHVAEKAEEKKKEEKEQSVNVGGKADIYVGDVKVPESNEAFIEKPLKPGYERPIIIHRAILGSVERMCAVLVEHTGGRLPFWLSPRQIIVLPISSSHADYGRWVKNTLHSFGFYTEIDDSNNTINKKVRDAQVEQWNYMLIVGDVEMGKGTVTVRCREDPKNQREMKMEDFVKELEKESYQNSQPARQLTHWCPEVQAETGAAQKDETK